MKFYLMSFFLHLVILLTIFTWDNSNNKSPIKSVPIEISMNLKEDISSKKSIVKEEKSYTKNENFPQAEKKDSAQSAKKIEEVKFSEIIENKILDHSLSPKIEEKIEKIVEEKPKNPEPLSDFIKETPKGIEEDTNSNIESPKDSPVSKDTVIKSDQGTMTENNNYEKTTPNKEEFSSMAFSKDGDTYIAKNQDIEGLQYKILKNPNPSYPVQGKKAYINKEIQIKARFTVNEKGLVEDIKFYDKEEKFGFREEVTKALENWRFSPITYNGKNIKMYFYKVFIFKINY